jgi:hypothetical protein
MLAFESESGMLWFDDVVNRVPEHQSPRQLNEHFKLYGTLTDIFEDYERVSMITDEPVLGGHNQVYVHNTIGGSRRSNNGSTISWAVHRPVLHRMSRRHGVSYYGFDSVSEPIAKRIGTFFAVTPEATFAVSAEKRAVPAQPATIRAIRKLTERYVIL